MAFGKFSQLRRRKPEDPTHTDRFESLPLVQVIDDDVRIRQGLQLNLQRRYRVRLCTTGEEGIQMVDDEVTAIILDIKMPGKNGLQVYETIKLKFPDIPIIFYSAYQGVLEGAELHRKYKPFNYIDKSANVQELLDTIERAVKYSQTRKQVLQTEHWLSEVKKHSTP